VTTIEGVGLAEVAQEAVIWHRDAYGDAPIYRNMLDRAALEDMLALPLTPSWRKLVQGRLMRGEVESWAKRIDGPASTTA